ncbi:MAG: hypothetical protein LBS74_11785 [Oscillospiraceae bacterium]|jgi:hypothetical protein|nr:hypothetical protein [Oscillospiraceae bacterium]
MEVVNYDDIIIGMSSAWWLFIVICYLLFYKFVYIGLTLQLEIRERYGKKHYRKHHSKNLIIRLLYFEYRGMVSKWFFILNLIHVVMAAIDTIVLLINFFISIPILMSVTITASFIILFICQIIAAFQGTLDAINKKKGCSQAFIFIFYLLLWGLVIFGLFSRIYERVFGA